MYMEKAKVEQRRNIGMTKKAVLVWEKRKKSDVRKMDIPVVMWR